MDVLLLNAPWTHPFHPGLSTAALSASLRTPGVDVIQRDASIEAFDYLISTGYVGRCRDVVETRLRGGVAGPDRERLVEALLKGELAIDRLDQALADLRDGEAYYDPDRLLVAQRILAYAFDLVSAAHSPLRWKDIYWEMPGVYQTAALAAAAARDDADNPFVDFYRERLLPSLAEARPRLIGLSFSLDQMSQLVPGLALARVLREQFPEAHICAGGIVLSKLEKQRAAFAPLFDFVDSIVLFEGETALRRLLEALDGGGSDAALAQVPNLVIRRDGVVVSEPDRHVEDVERLPTADFAGLPLERYLAPELILPFAMSRGGCYYGKCTFCDTTAGHAGPNRRRSIARIVDDLARMTAATGARRFLCVDEAIEVPRLEEFALAIVEARLDIRWSCWSRAIRPLDRRRLGLLNAAGCTVITYGVDSGSDRVLRDMRKGTVRTVMRQILEDSHASGIAASVNVILGYPAEERQDLLDTIDFLFDVRDTVVKTNLLPFFFKAGTPVHEARDRYPVDVHPAAGEDLVVFFGHEYRNGLTQAEVNRLCEEVEAALGRRCPVHRFVGDVSQHPSAFLYFSRFGLTEVRRLAEGFYAGEAGEPAPDPPIAAGARPRLAGAVQIRWPSPWLRALLGPAVDGRALCIDVHHDALSWIPAHAARILERCDGRTTVQDIGGHLEDTLLVGPLGARLVIETLRAVPPAVLSWQPPAHETANR